MQGDLQNGHSAIERLQKQLDDQRMERTKLQKDVEAAEQRLQAAENDLADRQSLLDRIQSEVAEKQASIERWRAERETTAARMAEVVAQLEAEREAARSSGEDIMALGTSVAEARAEAEKARERGEDAARQIEACERDIEGITRQEQARQREIETLAEEDALLNEQIARIQSEMDQHRIEFDRLSQKLSLDQQAREELQIEIRRLAGEVEALTRDERQLDNRMREIQLEHAELHANLQSLEEQCAERFETTLKDLGRAIGAVDRDPRALQAEVAELRDKLGRIGPVNMAALEEYEDQKARLEFLQGQHADLAEAKQMLEATIQRLDDTTRKLFHETFEVVRSHFIEMFRKLFNGGKADLILEAPEGIDPLLDGGIEIMVQPPGKKLQSITLLSGGEKAMTAISLLFALFLHKPSPFCVLDEIDAPLDDANVGRFCRAVDEFKTATQFVVITHNKLTMELADAIYGVTMEESGVSKVVSVRFDQAERMVDAG